MNRSAVLALGIVLLFCAPTLAQHASGGGRRRGTPGAGTASGTSDTGLTDFNHALALQATPDQASRFLSLAKSTEDARKQAQDLLRMAAKADDPAEFSKLVASLKDTVEDVQSGNRSFVKSFSKSQKSGLKDLTKKLDKADSEITKQKKALDQHLGLPRATTKGLPPWRTRWKKRWRNFRPSNWVWEKRWGSRCRPSKSYKRVCVVARATRPRPLSPCQLLLSTRRALSDAASSSFLFLWQYFPCRSRKRPPASIRGADHCRH